MRYWLAMVLLINTFNIFSQDQFVPQLWVPQKTDSSWILFAAEDSLKEPVRVDSVVVSSYADLLEMAVIAINKGKYGLFSSLTENHGLFKHEYDSMFVHQEVLLSCKNRNWNLTYVSDLYTNFETGKKLSTEPLGKIDSFYVNDEGVFYWQNGLQGLIDQGGLIIPANYKYIRVFSKDYESNYFLASNGVKVGLLKGKKEVLPVQYEAIEHYKYGWYRFWIRENDTLGYWDYLSPENRVIHTNGHDFRVYSEELYKQYNPDRTQARLYKNGQELNFGYDDYFLLKRGFLAVRKNEKIGMIDISGKVFFEPQFDQVEILDEHRIRVLKDKAWFLADYNGNVLSKTGFGAIVLFQINLEGWESIFENQKHYAVNSLNGMGVMNDQGKVIVSANYSKISRIGKFFVANNGTNVVYNEFGKRVSDKIYPEYGKSFDEFIVMRTREGTFDILSTEGQVNSIPFERFAKYDGAFKCYSKSALELVVMSDSLPAHVEEIQRFSLDNTVAIEQLDSLPYWSALWTVDKSELEETQKNGYWNLRETKTAQNDQSNWIDVIHSSLPGTTALAVSEYRSRVVNIPFGPEMNTYFSGRIVDYAGKSYRSSEIISSTATKPYYSIRSSTDDLEIYADGSQHWNRGSTNTSGTDPNRVFDIEYCLGYGFAATTADEVDWKADPETNFDLFSWWFSKNDFANIHPSSSALSLVMDPKLKAVQGESKVVIRSNGRSNSKRSDYLNNSEYDEFLSLATLWSSDEEMFLARQLGSDTVLWFNFLKDSAVIKAYSAVKIKANDFAITESLIKNYGYIHPSEPSFVFDPTDTNNFNKQYVYGRLLVKDEEGTRLESVHEENLFETTGSLKVLDNGFFYLSDSDHAGIVDRNGVESVALPKGNMISLSTGNYLLQTTDSIYWYSGSFQKMSSASGSEISPVLDNCWLVKRSNERMIYDSGGKWLTSLEAEENLSENGWLVKKTKTGFSYRFPVSNRRLDFRARPEEHAKLLLKKEGDFYSVYNVSGNEILPRSKHMDLKKERGDFLIFSGKKSFMVFDKSGTCLFTGETLKSAEELDGILYVETKDTVYEVHSNDLMNLPVDTKNSIASIWKIGSESAILLPAKQGAAFYYGQCIIPAIYDKVFYAGSQFFVVQSGKSFLTYRVGLGFVKTPGSGY